MEATSCCPLLSATHNGQLFFSSQLLRSAPFLQSASTTGCSRHWIANWRGVLFSLVLNKNKRKWASESGVWGEPYIFKGGGRLGIYQKNLEQLKQKKKKNVKSCTDWMWKNVLSQKTVWQPHSHHPPKIKKNGPSLGPHLPVTLRHDFYVTHHSVTNGKMLSKIHIIRLRQWRGILVVDICSVLQ